MIKQPDQSVLRALVALKRSDDFKVVVAWFQDSLDETRKLNDRQLDVILLRHGQGSAQTLDEIIGHTRNCDAQLKK
jgi:DNA-directed RNA polymerase sigma subunit (sigma70/sigma32)